MRIGRNIKNCLFVFKFSFGIILFITVAFAILNRSTKIENGEELKKDQALIKDQALLKDRQLKKDAADNVIEISENYKNLINLTFNSAKRKIISESYEIVAYDMTKNISQQLEASIPCIFLTKNEPHHHLCLHKVGTDGVSDEIRRALEWDPEAMAVIKSFFVENPNATMLDLGSNIGALALYAAVLNSNVKVVGVEPFPQNVLRIHKAAHLNKVQDRIKIILAAMSDKRGPVTFNTKIQDFTQFSLVRPDRQGANGSESFTINAILFDDLRHFIKTKKAMIKIDIEGMECFAFMNADKIFDAVDFPIILMEIEHTVKHELCFTTMLKFLNNRGYIPYNYPLNKSLNYAEWRTWEKRKDVYFKKLYNKLS